MFLPSDGLLKLLNRLTSPFGKVLKLECIDSLVELADFYERLQVI
ncbi:MAG TPA: hypothetical protein VFH21_02240 [Burkholderiales bacterium]|nr:hypothetical protein [Burkholderiales bacterium]